MSDSGVYGFGGEDIFEIEALIPEEPGIHPEVRLWFRPLSMSQVDQLNHLFRKESDDKKKEDLTYEIIAKQIHSWTLKKKTRKGEVVPAEPYPENLKALVPSLYTKIAAIVMGREPAVAGKIEAERKNS